MNVHWSATRTGMSCFTRIVLPQSQNFFGFGGYQHTSSLFCLPSPVSRSDVQRSLTVFLTHNVTLTQLILATNKAARPKVEICLDLVDLGSKPKNRPEPKIGATSVNCRFNLSLKHLPSAVHLSCKNDHNLADSPERPFLDSTRTQNSTLFVVEVAWYSAISRQVMHLDLLNIDASFLGCRIRTKHARRL